MREGLAGAEQFEDGFGELRAGGPGFVDAGAGEHVGGAGALADAGEAVAGEDGLAAAAGLLERLCAPGAEGSVFEDLPQGGVLDVVLQIAVGGAAGVAEPGGDEDADGDETVGMDVEKAEDLGLGIAEGVPDGAGLQCVGVWSLRAVR